MIINLNVTGKNVENVFRYAVARDILLFLGKNRYKQFTISDIARNLDIRPNTGNLRRALQALVLAGLLDEKKEGRGKFLKIKEDVILYPEDPYVQIRQVEFREVVRDIVEKVKRDRRVVKVILFGGVARGTADRMSDIDFLVVSKDVMVIETKTSKIAHNCRTGKMFDERYGISFRVIDVEELKKPRGFVKDALLEGIVLYERD
jgi:predicted nucleotidyltransferase